MDKEKKCNWGDYKEFILTIKVKPESEREIRIANQLVKRTVEELMLPELKIYYKVIVTKTV